MKILKECTRRDSDEKRCCSTWTRRLQACGLHSMADTYPMCRARTWCRSFRCKAVGLSRVAIQILCGS